MGSETWRGRSPIWVGAARRRGAAAAAAGGGIRGAMRRTTGRGDRECAARFLPLPFSLPPCRSLMGGVARCSGLLQRPEIVDGRPAMLAALGQAAVS